MACIVIVAGIKVQAAAALAEVAEAANDAGSFLGRATAGNSSAARKANE